MNTSITITIISVVVLAAGGLSQVYAQTNSPPTTNDFTLTTSEGVALSGILAGESTIKTAMVNLTEVGHISDPDQEASTLAVTISRDPTQGLALVESTVIMYVENSTDTAFGSDTFEYTVTDDSGATATGEVTVAIFNKPPITFSQDNIEVTTGATKEISIFAIDDGPGVDDLQLTITTEPTQGTIEVTGLVVSYTARADGYGPDTIEYNVTDFGGEMSKGTINIRVVPPQVDNTPPTATDFAIYMAQSEVFVIDLDGECRVTDVGQDAGTLRLVIERAPPQTQGTARTPGSDIVYTANDDAAGVDRIRYTVIDDQGESATGLITINLVDVPPNMPPAAADFAVSAGAGTSIMIDLSENNCIYDPDDDTLDITITGEPSRGTASVNGTVITYAADATAATGADTIVYIVSDGQGDTATGTITVNVAGAASTNRNPTVPQIISVGYAVADEAVINLKAIISDPDGDELIITITGQPSKGTATVHGTMIVYTPDEGATGIDRVNYEVSDGQGGTATGTITINVAGAAGGPDGTGGTVGTGGTGGTVGTGGTGGPDGTGGYTLEGTGLTPQSDATLGDDEAPSNTAPSRVCAR